MNLLRLALSLALAAFVAASTAAQDLPAKFEPQRDAAADVATAVALAKKQGKRVLVDVGGEWCPWCHILDRFVAANADVRALTDANYVWVKVNWSKENKNEALLSRWPAVKGYPHLFVLDADGRLVHSQDTGLLEDGKDYDKCKVRRLPARMGDVRKRRPPSRWMMWIRRRAFCGRHVGIVRKRRPLGLWMAWTRRRAFCGRHFNGEVRWPPWGALLALGGGQEKWPRKDSVVRRAA